jgi:hypothetical protein
MIIKKIKKNGKEAVIVPFKEATTAGLPYKRHSNPRLAIVYCDWDIADKEFNK